MADDGLIKTKILYPILPAILVVGQIFIFGPAIIYHGNISEFGVTLIEILKFYAFPAIALLLIFIGVGALISKKYLSLYISLIFCIGILLWLQGNIIVWKYGLLDGQIIKWDKGEWRGWLDISLWLILLGLACIFHRKLHRKFITIASIVIICLQLTQIGYYILTVPPSNNKQSPILPSEEIFNISQQNNIFHIVLDAFQSTIFQDIIDQRINYYQQKFEGFTFFKETVGVFPTTFMTIPAILSGRLYQNDVPMQDFVNRTLAEKTIPNVLFKNGYTVDLIHIIPQYVKGNFSNAYLIPTPYIKDTEQYNLSKATLLLDLVLFRYAPHFLKKGIYNNQNWLFQRTVKQENSKLMFASFSHKEFFADFNSKLKQTSNKPVYKFIHLATSHPPAVVDENCEYAGEVLPWNKKNKMLQAKCALSQFIQFLDKLKALGCYDSTMIILQADTGAGDPVNMGYQTNGKDKSYIESVVGSALPLLAIKQPHSQGPLKYSNAQVSLADIPATIIDALDLNENFPGKSILKIDEKENRIRKFYYYKWLHTHWQSNFLPNLTEYNIKGSAFYRDSWQINKVTYSKETSYKAKMIDLGKEEANNFLHLGWSGNEKSADEKLTYNWALGNSASVFISFSKESQTKLSAKMKTIKFENPQHITIAVDGITVGKWELSPNSWNWEDPWSWDDKSVIVPPDGDRPNVSIVEFLFSEHRKNSTGQELRPLAVLFDNITLEEINFNK